MGGDGSRTIVTQCGKKSNKVKRYIYLDLKDNKFLQFSKSSHNKIQTYSSFYEKKYKFIKNVILDRTAKVT